jgi:hypothetical protein
VGSIALRAPRALDPVMGRVDLDNATCKPRGVSARLQNAVRRCASITNCACENMTPCAYQLLAFPVCVRDRHQACDATPNPFATWHCTPSKQQRAVDGAKGWPQTSPCCGSTMDRVTTEPVRRSSSAWCGMRAACAVEAAHTRAQSAAPAARSGSTTLLQGRIGCSIL